MQIFCKIFEIIRGGGIDWVGKEWVGLLFPRGKNGPAHSFPGEKTDWGEIPACYTGLNQYQARSRVKHSTTVLPKWVLNNHNFTHKKFANLDLCNFNPLYTGNP